MLPLLLGALLLAAPGCYDESDACRDYCHQAAHCLNCSATTESLDRCQDECIALTISEQKALANCAKDCANFFACPSIVGFTPPNPCDY
jgi:hypothetical protein